MKASGTLSIVVCVLAVSASRAFTPLLSSFPTRSRLSLPSSQDFNEWTSDFDDFVGDGDNNNNNDDEDDSVQIASIFQRQTTNDLSGTQTRQFLLGRDLVLDSYLGNLGFDEVVDWEYYYQNEDDPNDRKVIQPNIFDSSQPKRTRKKSGSVVRLFRGEFSGTLGGVISSQGLDRRILIKEFTGELALQLARYELLSVGKLQSDLLAENEDAKNGWWVKTASSRSVMSRQDNDHVKTLSSSLSQVSWLGILGEVNLSELESEMDPNEFYRALGVVPPKPGAVWLVYEYQGLNTIASYAIPGEIRRSRIPPKKGFFGAVLEPPSLPAWPQRAKYVLGIMKRATEAVATLHESGIVHRSIGRNSFILTSSNQDKSEAANVYSTSLSSLRVKITDFGFSGLSEESTFDEEFCVRARSFGLNFRRGQSSLASINFAMAEDLHALSFVFLGLLLSSLAELPNADFPMPATDEDTLQRLLGDIFSKDMTQFREYVEAEEVWSKLVELLDENEGAGWNLLELLFTAREVAAANKDSLSVITARSLLSNSIFQS